MRAEARNREENHTDKIVLLFFLTTDFLIVGFLELLSKFYLSTATLVGAGSGSVQAAGLGWEMGHLQEALRLSRLLCVGLRWGQECARQQSRVSAAGARARIQQDALISSHHLCYYDSLHLGVS